MKTKHKVGNDFKLVNINHITLFNRYGFNLYKVLEHKLEKQKTGNQKMKSIKAKDQRWENQQKCSVLVKAKEKANQRTNC